MAILSQEVNRFLGSALLDPLLAKCLFSNDRAKALQGFNFQPSERKTILTSQACTLQELSRELTAACAIQDSASAMDAAVERFYQSVHTGKTRTSTHIESVALRVINTLSVHQAADATGANTNFVKVSAAS